jgi:hypothetical protein
MITNPTRQRALRGHKPTRPTPRAANTTDHHAVLAWRLTPRDRWIIRMLHEHRVLTAHQITALAFPSFRSGRMRMRELFQYGVVDRFQPFISVGTAPMHYVLAPAGATVLAAENGLDVKELGYRHDRAFGVAHNLRRRERMVHRPGRPRPPQQPSRAHHPGRLVVRNPLRPPFRCDLIKPDAYGRWAAHGQQIEFFLEYDFGTEALAKLAGKLTGYAALAAATAITTPLLVWVPTSRREATARRLLHHAWQGLDDPRSVPVATAAAELLNPAAAHPSPADEVWLPLDITAGVSTRRALHRLLDAWPHVPPPRTDSADSDESAIGSDAPLLRAPAPTLMPPTTSRAPSTSRQ